MLIDVVMNSRDATSVTVTVRLVGPDDDHDEAEEKVLAIIDELRDERGALGEVRRPREEAPPGSKGLGSTILGVFYAIVNPEKIRAFLAFLRERLGGRAANLEVIANGRSLRLSLGSASDLSAAVSECIRFVEATAEERSPAPTAPSIDEPPPNAGQGQLVEERSADPRALEAPATKDTQGA